MMREDELVCALFSHHQVTTVHNRYRCFGVIRSATQAPTLSAPNSAEFGRGRIRPNSEPQPCHDCVRTHHSDTGTLSLQTRTRSRCRRGRMALTQTAGMLMLSLSQTWARSRTRHASTLSLGRWARSHTDTHTLSLRALAPDGGHALTQTAGRPHHALHITHYRYVLRFQKSNT